MLFRSWLKQNTAVESRLFSNSPVILFYAEKPTDPTLESVRHWDQLVESLRAGRWRDYDYLALRVRPRHEQQAGELRKAIGSPIATFSNEKGDTVWIYNLHAPSSH